MRKLLYLTAILIQFGLQSKAQVVDVIRTAVTPSTGASRNNRAVSDANLYIPYSLRIPRASAFTLNGAKDSIGYVMFNTASNRFGVYRGSGVWDTYIAAADTSAMLSTYLHAGTATGLYQILTNLSTSTSLGTSNILYPSQNAVKTYVDNLSSIYLSKSNNFSDVTIPVIALSNIGGIGAATSDILTNKSISGSTNIFTNIPNTGLTNSGITINGTLIPLGGSVTTSGGSVSNVSSSTGDIAVATPSTTPVLTLNNINGTTISYYDPTSSIQTQISSKEPTITSGTSSQYFRGDKTFQTLNTLVVPELTNLYYTNSRGIGSVLTGYTSSSGVISSTDNILQAIQKLNGNISSLVTGVSSVSGTTNRITSSGGSSTVIDIASTYAGQTSITTVGTLSTGSIPYSLLSGTTPTWNQNTIGSAATLTTARTINGIPFNGSNNIIVTANTPNSVTFNNSGSGGVSGTIFNGTTAPIISYNTIGAQQALGYTPEDVANKETTVTNSTILYPSGSAITTLNALNVKYADTASMLSTYAHIGTISGLYKLNSDSTGANGYINTTRFNTVIPTATLGRINATPIWQSGTSYAQYKTVSRIINGQTYQFISNTANNTTVPVLFQGVYPWIQFTGTYIGAWSAGSYVAGNIVSENGYAYACSGATSTDPEGLINWIKLGAYAAVYTSLTTYSNGLVVIDGSNNVFISQLQTNKYGLSASINNNWTLVNSSTMTVMCWGDSLTWGVGSTGGFNYPFDLSLLTGWNTYQGGVPGETSSQILTRFLADSTRYNYPAIIWAGRNNWTDTLQVRQDDSTMVAKLQAIGNTRYLVMGITSANGESNPNTVMDELNARLSAEFGERFIDINAYLKTQGNGTPQDNAAIARGEIPWSLRYDNTHFNDAGYLTVAKYIQQWSHYLTGEESTKLSDIQGQSIQVTGNISPELPKKSLELSYINGGLITSRDRINNVATPLGIGYNAGDTVKLIQNGGALYIGDIGVGTGTTTQVPTLDVTTHQITRFSRGQIASSANTIAVGSGAGTVIGANVNLDLAPTSATVGTFGDATHVGQFTVDQYGRIQGNSNVAITPDASLLTGTTLASNVIASSLTSLGAQSATLSTITGIGALIGGGSFAVAPSSTRGVLQINGSTDQFLNFGTNGYLESSASLMRLLSTPDFDMVVGSAQRLTISASTGNVGINNGLNVTGNATAPAFVTSGGTTAQLVDGTGALQTIPTQSVSRLASFYTDVAATTTAADAYSYTLAANSLTTDGQYIDGEYVALFAGGTGAGSDVIVSFGGTTIFDTGAYLGTGYDPIGFKLIRSGATTARCIVSKQDVSGIITDNIVDLTGLDFTVTNIVKVNIVTSVGNTLTMKAAKLLIYK